MVNCGRRRNEGEEGGRENRTVKRKTEEQVGTERRKKSGKQEK